MGNYQCIENSEQKDTVIIEKINKEKKMYALTNKLSRLPLQMQETIERMFILKQIHICDRIVHLMNNKRREEADKLMKDLSSFDCEEFDELYHYSSFSHQQSVEATKIKKISEKHESDGSQELKKARIVFIVPVECFWNLEVLGQSDLLSRKSKLQLYLQKIEGFRQCYRRKDDLVMIYLISPSSYFATLSKYVDNNIRLISYESTFPCFNHGGKICLFGNNIEFNETDGDLIHFMLTNQTLSQIQQKFDYICFNNINNLLGPVIDPKHIGYLKEHEKQEVIISLKTPEEISCVNNFIQISADNEIGACLLKASFVHKNHEKENNNYQLFSKQIRQVRVQEDEDKFYFGRSPRDILYSPCSTVTGAHLWAEDRIGYSEYCKEVLGISREKEDDLVEICPQILYGNPEKIKELRRKLEEGEGNIGYPLIVMKMK